jgi:thiamine-phosphate pyrophosphorylase
MEGIRVLEEAARMLFDDRDISLQLKNLRHDLMQSVQYHTDLSRLLLIARGSEYDVLRNGMTPHECSRPDLLSILEANSGRVQEALRALEEYSKLLYSEMPEQFKALRFRLYDMEKHLLLHAKKHTLLNHETMGVVVIFDCANLVNGFFPDAMIEYCKAGAGTVLCDTITIQYLDMVRRTIELCHENDTAVMISDRIDYAFILDADGVVLGETSIPPSYARQITRPDWLMGYRNNVDKKTSPNVLKNIDYMLIEIPGTDKHNPKHCLSVIEQFVGAGIPVIVNGIESRQDIEYLFQAGILGIALKGDIHPIGQTVKQIGLIRELVTKHFA